MPVETLTVYRVGAEGLRVVHADGSESAHPPFSLVWFARPPRRITGNLSPANQRRGGYEHQDRRPRE